MSQMPVPDQPSVSVGTLFFLFGDHVVEPVGGMFTGVETPYSGVKVKALDLAVVAFAASMWGLREAGALQLQAVTRKALLKSRTDVHLAFGSNLEHRTGFDDVVMRGVADGQEHACDVVRGWYRKDVVMPELEAFDIARHEMVTCGLGREEDAGRGAVGSFVLGRTRLEPDTAAIQAQWEPFRRAQQGWQRFRETEQPLAAALLESCERAIRSRRDTDRGD